MTLTTNKSFLANNKYEFVIDRLPNLKFFSQTVNLPDISLSATATPSPYVNLYNPGNQLTFGQLQISYIVDEDMQSWFELYTWMTNLGNPESLDKLGTLTKQAGKQNSVMSDASLLIKTNANNPNIKITFKDLFPVDLTGFTFSSIEGQDFITATAAFQYTYYTAEKL
jgi:hypothetical protein